MKILYQGGWKAGRDLDESKELIADYCRTLAKYTVINDHEIILTSTRDYDRIVADEISRIAKEEGKNIKDHLLYLLPERVVEIPSEGKVRKFGETRWWIEERTYLVQQADAVVAIGGGRGTFDCVEKAFLSCKPVFVAPAIPCLATDAWKRRRSSYKYLTEGDADFLDDLNITPDEFFQAVFGIVNSLSERRYTRRIFVVHGRDEHFRDGLVKVLEDLDFDPIVLQAQPDESLTVIEKLERDVANVGFSFVLYTPDDLGHLLGESAKPRARQNVIFEHGLLIGLLGRDRTCAIIKDDLEIPSDIRGMIHASIYNCREEALKIVRILKDAKYEVDVGKLV